MYTFKIFNEISSKFLTIHTKYLFLFAISPPIRFFFSHNGLKSIVNK